MGEVMTRAYQHGELAGEGFPFGDASEHLAAPDTTVWLDLCGPSRAELDGLARELGLHELAVESAVRPQRPRLVRYATHQFIAVPTLITGYFGMNVPYPGSEDVAGVVASGRTHDSRMPPALPPVPAIPVASDACSSPTIGHAPGAAIRRNIGSVNSVRAV